MNRPAAGRRAGQTVIEYAFLIVLIATILIGVVTLAGQQLEIAFNDISTDVGFAMSGGASAPQLSAPHSCSDGTIAVYRHTRFRCKNE